MKIVGRICMYASVAALCAARVSAQVMTVPQQTARVTVTCEGDGCESPASVLSRHLARGDMRRLQGYAAELLQTLAKTGPSELRGALGDVKRNYYRLVWMGRDDSGGASTVQSEVVHARATSAVRTLPGIKWSSGGPELIDVFISGDPGALIDTQYLSTPVKDPLAAQIPSFIERTGIVGFVSGLPIIRGAGNAVATTYTIARPVLPMSRADIRIKDTIVVPGSAAGLRNASTQLRDRLVLRDARLSPCAQKLAAADADAIAKGLSSAACTIPQGQDGGLSSRQVSACRAALSDLLEEAYEEAAACRDPNPSGGSDPLPAVDKQFNDLIASLRETRKSAESRLTNAPRTRYTLGVLSSAILGSPRYAGSAVRAKVGANGSLIQDPMPTVLTMMLVNVHVVPYDAQRETPAWSERVRLFAGTSLTPDFGLGIGGGVMVVRGLSVNAGWANLFVKKPAAGFAIGQTPPPGKAPLAVGRAGVWFAGLSYSFK